MHGIKFSPVQAQRRHGRACPGHPRLAVFERKKDVDARHKAGHDEFAADARDVEYFLGYL
ncbi:MAG: hypothetical protein K9G60_16935 [Pseudolabrys sp.]|nr:hypothetical protein [Pseudolabrys sp.]